MITNVIVIVGSGLTLIMNYPMLCLGRFLYGVAAGAFSVFVPKYISETSPVEVKGVAGGITQLTLTFGILVSFSLGTVFTTDSPDKETREAQQKTFL
jgi:MFS family permease